MTPQHGNYRDPQDPLHESPPRLGLRDEMYRLFREQNRVLGDMRDDQKKMVRFIEGEKGDGTDSAKVRLARVEWIAKVAIVVAGMFGTATVAIVVKVFFFGAHAMAATGGAH